MNRRTALALAATVPPALLAGCLNGVPLVGITREDLPEWPDEPTESAVTSYAARYRAVATHNERLDRQEDRSYRDGSYSVLSRAVEGAFEAETTAGYIVLTNGSSSATINRGPFRSDRTFSGMMSLETLLVNEDEVVRTPIDYEWDHGWEDVEELAPFSTRGLSLVNFSSESRRIEVSVEKAGTSDDDEEQVTETFDLDAEHGRLEPEFLDGTGTYEVTISANDTLGTHEWTVSDELREPTELPAGTTFDIALGIYVLPDGSLEIHEIPEERTTGTERIRQESILR